MVVFGVDEAGKGPVIGSMFAAAVAVPSPDILPEDVDDSKRVPPECRREIADWLADCGDVRICTAEVDVEAIDGQLSMDRLTARAHAEAIGGILDGVSPDYGRVDAAGKDPQRFAREVAANLDAHPELVAEYGADEEYPIVGAASIVAKVRRDQHVKRVADRYDVPLGSGYPGDDVTVEFLRKYVDANGELPECARRSWETSRRVLKRRQQTGLEDF